jgi:hypothetical protein
MQALAAEFLAPCVKTAKVIHGLAEAALGGLLHEGQRVGIVLRVEKSFAFAYNSFSEIVCSV